MCVYLSVGMFCVGCLQKPESLTALESELQEVVNCMMKVLGTELSSRTVCTLIAETSPQSQGYVFKTSKKVYS